VAGNHRCAYRARQMFSMLMESDDLIVMYQAKTAAQAEEIRELQEKLKEAENGGRKEEAPGVRRESKGLSPMKVLEDD